MKIKQGKFYTSPPFKCSEYPIASVFFIQFEHEQITERSLIFFNYGCGLNPRVWTDSVSSRRGPLDGFGSVPMVPRVRTVCRNLRSDTLSPADRRPPGLRNGILNREISREQRDDEAYMLSPREWRRI